MNVQPVIYRELLGASRRRETWRLRLVFGIAAMLAFAFGMLWPDIRFQERGMVVLICLAIAGFVLSLFTGAYLTADAITSEKREGTLGLLFLTPLNGWQIILGKMATHSLQVGYALMGAFPVFFLPVLLGSVVSIEVLRILLVLVTTLGLSLACGIFFSTRMKEARNAVLATAITMLLLTLLPWLPWLIGEMSRSRLPLHGLPQLSPMTALIFAFEDNYNVKRTTQIISGELVFWGSLLWLAISALMMTAASGWLLPRVWRQSESGERDASSPRWAASAARKTVPKWALPMDKAPLLWLAARDLRESLWLKLVRWLAFAFFAFMLVLAVSTRHWEEGFISAFCTAYGLHLMSRVQLILATTRRLHEDRQSGALEAILATPVSNHELMSAHHVSLKRSFRAILTTLLVTNITMQLAVAVFFKHLHMGHGTWAIFSVFITGGAVLTLSDFSALRWIGLREAICQSSQLKAAGRVLLLNLVLPWIAFAITWIVAIQTNEEYLVAFIFALWFAACLAYNWVLTQNCRLSLRAGFRRRVAGD